MRRQGAAFPGIAPTGPRHDRAVADARAAEIPALLARGGKRHHGTSFVAFQPATNCKALEIRQHAWGKLVGSLEPINRFAIAPGFQMAVGRNTTVEMDIWIADIDVHGPHGTRRTGVNFTLEYLYSPE